MPTPKQLTQMAYDLGVSGVDLNTLTFAVVDAMEASDEYFGPYDSEQRNFLEKYLIEEITPDRIDYCYSWLERYIAIVAYLIDDTGAFLSDEFGNFLLAEV